MTYQQLLEAIEEGRRREAAYAAACNHPDHSSPNPTIRDRAEAKVRKADRALYEEIEL